MELFYHPRLGEGRPVPSILGLTASPVMKADPSQLVSAFPAHNQCVWCADHLQGRLSSTSTLSPEPQ